MILLAHLVGLLATIGVSGGAAWWVRQQTDNRAGTVMIAILLAHVAMAVLAVGILTASTVTMMVVTGTVFYAVLVSIPVLWFLFAIYYTGREYWLTKRVWIVLGAISIVPAGLILANGFTGLFLVDQGLTPGRIPVLEYERTGLMDLMLIVVHVPAFVGFGLLLRTVLFSRRNTRLQLLALLVGMAAIVVTTAIVDTPIAPVRGFPYGVYGSGVFGLLVAVALFRTQLFAVTPLARDTLFESLDEAVVVLDSNRSIVDYNERAIDLLPELETHAGDRLDDAYPAFVTVDEPTNDGGSVEATIERLEGTLDSPFAGKIRLSTGDESRTFQTTVSEISSGGHLRGYALVVRDVTKLERYANDLERKTEQLERFAGVLSHDLRNPVSVATGYVELARETGEPAHFQEALDALDRIDETIGDLLTLSRDGEAIEDPEVVSIRSIVADAWSTSDTGEAVFEPEIDDDMRIYADSSRLRTLLENLFRNAVDHGGETVRVGSLDDGFFVEDDGPGIPADEREAVFEHGYSTREDGTGFGLAIVDSIATAHDWSIAVTEGRDGGARFEVTGVAIA